MYEIFKVMLEAAEKTGCVINANVTDISGKYGKHIEISGTTNAGENFELSYYVKREGPEDE